MQSTLLNFLFLFIIALTIALSYSNTLNSPFVFDDDQIFYNELKLTELSLESLKKIIFKETKVSKTRFIPNLSFAFTYYFFGPNIKYYHLGNILIHILASFALFFLLKEFLLFFNSSCNTLKYSLIAFISTLIWSLHPINTNVVTYTVQRMTSLAALFIFLSLIFYLKLKQLMPADSFKRKLSFFLLFIISTLFAIFSKQIGALILIFILVFEIILLKNVTKRNLIFILSLCFIFILVGLFYTNIWNIIVNGYETREFSLVERIFTQTRVVLHYLSLWFFPNAERLTLFYDFKLSQNLLYPITTLVSFLFWFLLFSLIVYLNKKNKKYCFIITFFLVAHLIESTIIPLEIIFEHRMYVPSAFLGIIITEPLISFFSRRSFVIVSLFLILFLSFGTYTRNTHWKSNITLWEDALDKAPKNNRIYNNYGVYLLNERNDFERASILFKLGYDSNPHDITIASNHLITTLMSNNHSLFESLWKDYKTLIKDKKKLPYEPIINVSAALISFERYEEALYVISRIKKKDSTLLLFSGHAYRMLGDYHLALSDLQESLRLGNRRAKGELHELYILMDH